MNLYESIKVNKIDKNKIIKNEAIPANNQYNVEAENDNEKKLDIVEELANKFVEYLRQHEIFAELDDYSIAENQRTNDVYGVIDYSIEWGDWKHDHAYSEDLAKEFFKEDLSISEDVTEEDGSDTYSATHEFLFNLAPYLSKEMKESDEEYLVVKSYEDLPYEDFGASNTIGTLKDDKNFIIFDDNDVYIINGDIEELKKIIYSEEDEDIKLFDEFMDKNSKRADNELETKILVDTKRLSSEVLDESTDSLNNEELNEADRQLATIKDLDKILKMSDKELDDFDRNHSYENSDLAEYVRCKLLYAETGLAKHKECYEKALNALKDNKLNESFMHPSKYFELFQDEEQIDGEKWNNASQEERDNMVKPQVEAFWNKYKNEMTEEDIDKLIDDMEDSNWHTECRILTDIINSEREDNELKEADTMDINNLTKEQLWKLRNEIVLGSIYTNDYKNSFGIDPVAVYNFFDSFIEDAQVDDYGKPNNRKTADYDNAEELYKFYCSCENPLVK